MLIMVRVVLGAEIKCKIKRDDNYSPPYELERAPPPYRMRTLMFIWRRAYGFRFVRLFHHVYSFGPICLFDAKKSFRQAVFENAL
jgi:hypothetical protein